MLLDLEALLARTSATACQHCGSTQAYQHYDSFSPMKAETDQTHQHCGSTQAYQHYASPEQPNVESIRL